MACKPLIYKAAQQPRSHQHRAHEQNPHTNTNTGLHAPDSRSPQPSLSISLLLMAVQIVSDLHLELPKAYDVFEIAPKAPYLALLGDIGNVASHEDEFIGFLTR